MKIKILMPILATFFLIQCKDSNAEKLSEFNDKSKLINSNRFIKPEEIKGKNFDDFIDRLYKQKGVIQKHLPLESKTFIMGDNDSWLAGIRQGLLEKYSFEEIKKKDIIIKEATWEISETQFLTVWYERKNQKWIPIQDFIWSKGSEF